jgi:excinuclease ABC subunit A
MTLSSVVQASRGKSAESVTFSRHAVQACLNEKIEQAAASGRFHERAEIHFHSRRPRAQSQERRSRPAARQADRDDRLSGSGKSSLAFDTIYAEGQRRYVESLSAYARQFLEMMQKPDVDQIDGLSPAISIEQKTTSRNPRSTVGTVTEIYDYMRLLFARVGIPYSPATGLPIESQTVSQMVDRVMALEEGTRLYMLAPIVRGRKGEYRKEFAELMKKGFQRVKVDGDLLRDRRRALRSTRNTSTTSTSSWTAIVVRDDIAARLADSLETCLQLADGLAVAEFADKPLPDRGHRPDGGQQVEERHA